MKKLILLLLALLFVAASLSVFGASKAAQPAVPSPAPTESEAPAPTAEPSPDPTAEPEPDWLAAYRPVVESYLRFLAGEPVELSDMTERGDYYLVMGETGISFLARYGGTLGYCLRDLDGDGVPEFLVGAEGSEYYGGYLFDLFTLENGAPKRVLASSERVSYRLRSDGLIDHTGSGGASFSLRIVYALDDGALRLIDGAVVNGAQLYQVREDRADLFEMRETDVPLTEEAFSALTESWEAMTTAFPITPFS